MCFYFTSENQVATSTSTTTEVVIPCQYIGFVTGNGGSEIEEIKKVHGLFFYLSNILDNQC